MTSVMYRVENPETKRGLWYDHDGTFTEFIKTLDDAQCADMPMGYDPQFQDGGSWVSATDNLPELRDWVSESDAKQLEALGYSIRAYQVPDYRIINGHAAFRYEDVIKSWPLGWWVLAASSVVDL